MWEKHPEVQLGVDLYGELFWNIGDDLNKVYRTLNEYMKNIKDSIHLRQKIEAHINFTIICSVGRYPLYSHVKDGSIFQHIEDNDFLIELFTGLNRFSPSTFYRLYPKDIPLIRRYSGDFVIEKNKFWLSYIYSRDISSVLCWGDWILEAHLNFWSKNYKTLYYVMKEWRKDPPPRRVLKDFKNGLSEKKLYLEGRTILEDTLQRITKAPGSLPREFLELLFYFTNGKDQEHIRKESQRFILKNIIKMRMIQEEMEFFTEVIFGQKILKRIEEEMDDSGPRLGILRARVDFRKTLEMYGEEWSYISSVYRGVNSKGEDKTISLKGDTSPD